MPAPLIPMAIGLARFIPDIVELIGGKTAGDKAEKAATAAIGIAKAVTGKDDMPAVQAALERDPDLVAELQRQWHAARAGLEAEATARFTAQHETMRAELMSDDPFVKRARPTWLYLTGGAWFLQMVGMTAIAGAAVLLHPGEAGQILDGLSGVVGATIALWGIALPVMGVYLGGRTREKQTAMTGTLRPGVLEALTGALGGRGR